MQVSLFCTFEGSAPPRRIYADAADVVAQAETVGFHSVWIPEHHFMAGLPSPSILPLSAFLAAHTQRLRIGTAAVILPLHDPLRVAEDVAVVDQLSGGRVDFGVGKGGPFPAQFQAFHVEPESARPRMFQALERVLNLWEEATSLQHDGARQLPAATADGRPKTSRSCGCCGTRQGTAGAGERPAIVPRPYQQPHPPVFLAATSEETIAYAARRGHSLLLPQAMPLNEVAGRVALFRRLCADAPGAPAPRRVVVFRTAHVAVSTKHALEELRPLAEAFTARIRASSPPAGGEEAAGQRRPTAETLMGAAVAGDPARCREELEALGEAGCDQVALRFPWEAPDLARESLRRFASEVLPYV